MSESAASDPTALTGRDESHILFVDTRNTGLSAAAELIARKRFGDLGLTFESAGVDAEVGQHLGKYVRAALGRRGVDTIDHSARQVDRGTVDGAGLVLALERSQRERILEQWPGAATRTVLLAEAAAVAGWATAGPVTTSRTSAGVAGLDGTGRHTGSATAQWLVRQCAHEAKFDVAGPSLVDEETGEGAVQQIEDALAALLTWYARAIRG